jgi:hypothetical protein
MSPTGQLVEPRLAGSLRTPFAAQSRVHIIPVLFVGHFRLEAFR